MSFFDYVTLVATILQREGRLTYRGLQREFGFEPQVLDDLRRDLIFRGVARDEHGEGLVWAAERAQLNGADTGLMPLRLAVRTRSHPDETRFLPPADAAPQPFTPETSSTEPAVEPHRSEAELRQLTVMSCDLVGSTYLSGQLDPEDLREVVRAYQASAAEVIQHYDGQIAQYRGDGLLVYFGYPMAHEDDALRAVRSGLDMITAIAALNRKLEAVYRVQLGVRIGIHTGPVVVGEMVDRSRHEQLALGETPIIACQVERAAPPGTAVLSEVTARLAQRAFILEELGQHEFAGLSSPMRISRAVRLRITEADAVGTASARASLLIGRDEEIGLLRRCWAQSKEGLGQAVLISGEAGIGKSSLIVKLSSHVYQEGMTQVTYQCSPYAQQSALYPFIQQAQRLFDWQPQDAPEARLAQLEQFLAHYTLSLDETVPLLAALLSLPLPAGRYPALTFSSQQQRLATQVILAALLQEESERQPLLVVWEDLHWADPSTIELLGLLLDQAPPASMLHVLTYRPEFEPPWTLRSHMTPISLNRLERPQVEGMIAQLAMGKRLPGEVVDHVVMKTDGVPLYVEELTKMLLTSELLRETADWYELTGPLDAVAIPDTLQDSLMARLDQLDAAKEIAQLGAVLGREFRYAILQALSPLEEADLQEGLAQLVAAELLYQRGRPPRAQYLFKHALIRDAAYTSLLRSTRQLYHQRTANLLESQFPEVAAMQPELVAHHFSEAGCTEEAITYWYRAGQQAISRSANREAVSHLETGLEQLNTLAEPNQWLEQELDMQMALGSAIVVTSGYTDVRVGQVYDRAWALCQAIGNSDHDFSALRGRQVYHIARGDFAKARTLAAEVIQIAERKADAALLVGGHYTLGSTLLFAGELTSAQEHVEQGIALYDPDIDQLVTWPGSHPAVQCHIYRALILWTCGYPEQALQQGREALSQAQALAHPFTAAQTYCLLALLHAFRREFTDAAGLSTASIARCREHGVSFWLAFARVVQGWAFVHLGQTESGLAEIDHGIAAFRSLSGSLFIPLLLALRADAYLKLDNLPEAQATLSEALSMVKQNGEGWWESELVRLQSEGYRRIAVASSAPDDQDHAESGFQQALEIARRQQARALELRAAASLTRLWQGQGKSREARQLLQPVLQSFTEGYDTPDLMEARLLLENLGT